MPIQNGSRGLQQVFEDLGIKLRWNTRKLLLQYKAPAKGDDPSVPFSETPGEWAVWNFLVESHIRDYIAQHYTVHKPDGSGGMRVLPAKWNADDWRTMVNAVARARAEDDFAQYLTRALPEWDGTARLDGLLWGMFLVDETLSKELVEWASRYLYLGAVQRTFEPGCGLDEIVILKSEAQGIGKSSFVELSLPPNDRPLWFTSQLRLSDDPKRKAEAIKGRVVVEVAELSGLRRAALEDLKSYLTARDDGAVRLAYRQDEMPLPRKCVFVGTNNAQEPLPNDPSGNRRFVVINLLDKMVEWETRKEWFDANREQLWAEALVRYRQGERANLPPELYGAQAEANASPANTRLTNAVKSVVTQHSGEFVTTEDMVRTVAIYLEGTKGIPGASRYKRAVRQEALRLGCREARGSVSDGKPYGFLCPQVGPFGQC